MKRINRIGLTLILDAIFFSIVPHGDGFYYLYVVLISVGGGLFVMGK